jgi:hypothetical protein
MPQGPVVACTSLSVRLASTGSCRTAGLTVRRCAVIYLATATSVSGLWSVLYRGACYAPVR